MKETNQRRHIGSSDLGDGGDMAEDPNEIAELDKFLARGRLGGAQIDRMWEGLERRLESEPARWKRLLRWSPLALVPTAAAAALFLVPRDGEMRARGDGAHPVLIASCGVSSPCVVGAPLYLRVSADNVGFAAVFLVGAEGNKREIAGPFAVGPSRGPVEVDAKITPEASDVGGGLRFLVVVAPSENAAQKGEGETAALNLRVVP